MRRGGPATGRYHPRRLRREELGSGWTRQGEAEAVRDAAGGDLPVTTLQPLGLQINAVAITETSRGNRYVLAHRPSPCRASWSTRSASIGFMLSGIGSGMAAAVAFADPGGMMLVPPANASGVLPE